MIVNYYMKLRENRGWLRVICGSIRPGGIAGGADNVEMPVFVGGYGRHG